MHHSQNYKVLEQLKVLAEFLSDHHPEESAKVKEILKRAQATVPQHMVRPTQSQSVSKEPLHMILNSLGLRPGDNQGANFVNAALYLAEGITDSNLLLSAISIASLMPGLEELYDLITEGRNLDPTIVLHLAKLTLQYKEKIRATFTGMKNPKVIAYIERYVARGSLLPKYADRIFEELRKWALNVVQNQDKINKQPAQQTAEQPVEKTQ